MILVHRSGMTAIQLAEITGYGRTYISKLYNVPELNKKQIAILSTALNVSPEIFDEEIERRVITLENEVKRIRDLENRIRVLEAENSGLRKALHN